MANSGVPYLHWKSYSLQVSVPGLSASVNVDRNALVNGQARVFYTSLAERQWVPMDIFLILREHRVLDMDRDTSVVQMAGCSGLVDSCLYQAVFQRVERVSISGSVGSLMPAPRRVLDFSAMRLPIPILRAHGMYTVTLEDSVGRNRQLGEISLVAR